MQANKPPSEDATIEIRADFAFDEASDGRSLLARVREKALEVLSDDFVEKRLFRLVALVVDQADPVRDRVRVALASVDDMEPIANRVPRGRARLHAACRCQLAGNKARSRLPPEGASHWHLAPPDCAMAQRSLVDAESIAELSHSLY